MILYGATETSSEEDGPQYRGHTTSKGSNTVTTSIPSQAQVGDYLVLVGSNGLDVSPSSSNGWYTKYSGQALGGTYFWYTRIHIKICTESDIGASVDTSASGFYHQNILFAFSNPNKSRITQNTIDYPLNSYYSLYYAYGVYSSNQFEESLTTTSAQSSISITPTKSRSIKSLKLSVASINPNSGSGNGSMTNAGSTVRVTDSYWYTSLIAGYEPDTVSLDAITANFSSSGSIAMQTVCLV